MAITSSIPLEYLLSNEPRVYERRDQTYGIYWYAANPAGIIRLIGSSSPCVEVSMLRCNESLRIIPVNHLNSEVSIELRLRGRLSLIELGQTGNCIRPRSSQCRLALRGYCTQGGSASE